MSNHCETCGKTLASPAGLRRHINSQHQRKEWHKCECGKQFLDPAGRSRCRARHSKSFGCPAYPCTYQSSRKDSVKQHIKRRHGPSATRLEIRTLPIGAPAPGSSSAPAPSESDTELSASYSPPPSLHMAEVPYLLHPPLESSVQPGQLGLYSLPPPPAPSAMYYDGHIPQYMSAYHAESA